MKFINIRSKKIIRGIALFAFDRDKYLKLITAEFNEVVIGLARQQSFLFILGKWVYGEINSSLHNECNTHDNKFIELDGGLMRVVKRMLGGLPLPFK